MAHQLHPKTLGFFLAIISIGTARAQVLPAVLTDSTGRFTTARLTGIVTDSATNQPIAFASIALYTLKNEQLTKGGTSNERGMFSLTQLPPGTYRLLLSFVGYRTKEIRPVTIEPDSVYQLGLIRLQPDVQLLKEVDIVGQKALVEEKADRLVYNADKDLTAKGGTATDIMRKVPMLSVDLDGNLLLRGSQNVRVLVNGKPSAIMAGNVADALKQMPADLIRAVEVIRSPSAKYDAEGSAGVINIITKKNTVQGFSLGLDSGLGNRGGSLGLTGTLRTPKMNVSLNGFGWLNYNIKGAFRNTQSVAQSSTEQTADTRSHAQFGQYTLGWDYDLSKNSALAASVRYSTRNDFANQDHLATRQLTRNALLPSDLRNVQTANLSQSIDVNLDYTHTFSRTARSDVRPELSFLTLYSRNNRTNDFTADVLNPGNGTQLISRDRNDNPSLNQEFTLQADYLVPLNSKQLLEIGSKGIFRQVNSDYAYGHDPTGTGTYTPSPLYSANSLLYQQHVLANYVVYTLTTATKFMLKAGLRHEYTAIDARFQQPVLEGTSASQIPAIPSYGSLMPSLLLSKTLMNGKALKLGYTRRLQRPGIQFLNPNPNLANPLNLIEGNPLLRPEASDNLEFSTSTALNQFYLNASLFARFTHNAIQPVRDTLHASGTLTASQPNQVIIRTTYQNIGQERAYGLNLSGNGTFFSKLLVSTGLDLYYDYLTNNSPDPIYASTNAGWVISGQIFSGLSLKKGWSLQGFGLLKARQVQVQGYQGGFTFYMLGIKKDFLNKRGSLGLATENFLNHPFKVRTELTSPILSQHSVMSYYNAGVRVNFSYRLGKSGNASATDRTDRKRKAVNNDDVKGGIDKGEKQ